jgi:small subunit ribosomal protein S6
MLKEDRWGKRKLAYPINKFEEAFYVFFHYEGEHDVPSELERRFKQTDTILRYLTIKRELKEDIKERKKPVKAKEKEAEMPEAGDEKEAVEKKVEEDIMEKEDLPSDELKEEEK